MIKVKNWQSGLGRPEDSYISPESYYDKERVEKYNNSRGMKKTQHRIAKRILELLSERGINKGRLLDLGCGVGYTMEVYREEGFEVVGIDKLERMLEKARERGLIVKKGDMKDLPFKEKFDAVVSASALQWLSIEEVREVASEVKKLLKSNGQVIIQFYPSSKKEMMKIARQFKKEGFEGKVVIDNPDRAKKREVYLVFGVYSSS